MPLTFPTHLFNPSSIKLTLQGRTITSPPSISGVGQVLRTDGGGFWVCEMSGIILRTPDQIRAWRAWLDVLDAGVTRVNVPIADTAFAPRPLHGRRLARPSQLRNSSADEYFPEATAFASPLVIASASPASHRATEITINVSQGSRLKGGEHFSLQHGSMGHRVYRTGRVLSRNDQTATVAIRPPLREAFGGGNANFDWAMFEAVLVGASDPEPDISNGRRAEVAIAFREAF